MRNSKLMKPMTRFALTLCVLSGSVIVSAAPATPEIYGVVAHNDQWNDIKPYYNKPTGLYSFNPSAGQFELTPVGVGDYSWFCNDLPDENPFGYQFYNAPGVMIGDVFYATSGMISEYGDSFTLSSYDFNSKVYMDDVIYSAALKYVSAMAYSVQDEKTYAVFYEEDYESTSSVFGTTGFRFGDTRQDIAAIPNRIILGMTVSRDGILFGIDGKGNLVTIDKSTGQVETIGSTGLSLKKASQGICFAGSTLYVAACDPEDETALYTVDTKTGSASKVLDFPDHIYFTSLYTLGAGMAAGVPGSVSGLTASFPEGDSEGTVTFIAPEHDLDGNPLEGELTYTVSDDFGETVTGQCEPGKLVTESFIAAEGPNKISVVVANEAGQGVSASVDVFIGLDTPVVSGLDFTIDNTTGETTLTWTIEPKGANNGFVNTDDVTYRIRRFPEDKLVADDFSGTFFNETLQKGEPVAYRYEVTPVHAFKDGAPVRSAAVILGDYFKIPYEESFTSTTSFDLFTAIDSNEDGFTWEWLDYIWRDEKVQYVNTQKKWGESDDWLISPFIRLYAGIVYTVSLDARKAADEFSENLDIYIGQDLDITGYMKITTDRAIHPASKDDWRNYTRKFTVPEDGLYHIGLHACSDNGYYILVDNLKVDGDEGDIPSKVSNIEGESSEVEFYDLTGCKVSSPQSGIYLRKTGDKVVKVMVR